MQAINISNLNFTYSKKSPYEKQALKNINLQVEEGTFLCIIGATGSGKSTLIQHLNGLIKIQDKKQSDIQIFGVSTKQKRSLKTIRHKVGMVFQYPEYQLFEDTVAKDIAFGPKNMKLPKEEISKLVYESMQVVGLDPAEFAERSPFNLSGGEKRRVAIAGVIAMKPEILILDEPVAGLDPVTKIEILTLLKRLQKQVSPTIILVSHNMDDVALLADRVIVLSDGEIAMDGTPTQVFADTQKIGEVGLGLPTPTRIACALVDRGINLPSGIVSMSKLTHELGLFRAQKYGAMTGDDTEIDKAENKDILSKNESEKSYENASEITDNLSDNSDEILSDSDPKLSQYNAQNIDQKGEQNNV